MRPLSRRPVSALLVTAVLASLVSAATGLRLPTAAAHNETPSTWECDHPRLAARLRDAQLPQPVLPLHDHELLPPRRVGSGSGHGVRHPRPVLAERIRNLRRRVLVAQLPDAGMDLDLQQRERPLRPRGRVHGDLRVLVEPAPPRQRMPRSRLLTPRHHAMRCLASSRQRPGPHRAADSGREPESSDPAAQHRAPEAVQPDRPRHRQPTDHSTDHRDQPTREPDPGSGHLPGGCRFGDHRGPAAGVDRRDAVGDAGDRRRPRRAGPAVASTSRRPRRRVVAGGVEVAGLAGGGPRCGEHAVGCPRRRRLPLAGCRGADPHGATAAVAGRWATDGRGRRPRPS